VCNRVDREFGPGMLHSYNIVDNHEYKTAFALDVTYKDLGDHLESKV
jgi:hypothetical protein